MQSRTEKIGDFLNPVLVREVRQSINGRVFRSVILLMLGICFLITVIGARDVETGSGSGLFNSYFVVLFIMSLIIMPFGAFQLFRQERDGKTYELLMMTTLHPRQIVRGKLICAIVQLSLLYSVITPFMAFSYLLKGIDILTIIFLCTLTFLYAVLLCMFGLMLSALATNRSRNMLLSLAMLFLLLGQMGIMGEIFYEISRGSSVGSLLLDRDFVIGMICFLLQGISLLIILYLAAASLITFAAANRSTALRLAITANLILTTVMFAFFWYDNGYDSEALIVYFTAYVGPFWGLFALFCCTESPGLSKRVRSEVPATRWGRIYVNLFYPGLGRGLNLILLGLVTMLGLGSFAIVGDFSSGG
ncbi:ABC transporter permease, partial [Planctomycetota bacterium]